MGQREEFVQLASRLGNIRLACRRAEVSPTTAYKWMSRYRERGRPGLEDLSRRPFRSPRRSAEQVDGNGQLLLPTLVESHVHIDKTLWGLPWRPHSAGPSLKDLIAQMESLPAPRQAPDSNVHLRLKLTWDTADGVACGRRPPC